MEAISHNFKYWKNPITDDHCLLIRSHLSKAGSTLNSDIMLIAMEVLLTGVFIEF